MKEYAIQFSCEGAPLLGVIHEPDVPSEIGMIIVVAGGPQYRVGVNRQFVMLARALAENGVTALRFDHRGTGDSGGTYQGFLGMSADINSAVDELQARQPGLKKVVLWGECESASAIAFYAHSDSRVSGIFLVNPWIRTEEGEAKAYLKHYYLERLFDKAFWRKLVSGKVSVSQSTMSLLSFARSAGTKRGESSEAVHRDELEGLPLPVRLEKSIARYSGQVFIITSGKDFIAREFCDYVAVSPGWKIILKSGNVQQHEVADADHSFSRLEWRKELFENTGGWIKSLSVLPDATIGPTASLEGKTG